MVVPVIWAAASEARNTAVPPSCSGVTNCSDGCFSPSSSRGGAFLVDAVLGRQGGDLLFHQ
ncbi:hypothetical protein RD23_04810, partial [Bordetella pertussis]